MGLGPRWQRGESAGSAAGPPVLQRVAAAGAENRLGASSEQLRGDVAAERLRSAGSCLSRKGGWGGGGCLCEGEKIVTYEMQEVSSPPPR